MVNLDNNDSALVDEAKQLAGSFDVNELAQIATPALLVDEAVLNRNIAWMADYCRKHSIALRPHAKTHKSLEIARRQLAAGAFGLSVAKASEAEIMAETGAKLLIAYPPITPSSLQTIDTLRQQVGVIVAVDSLEAVELLAANMSPDGTQVGVLVDIDLGLHRTGFGLLRNRGRSPSEWRVAVRCDSTVYSVIRGTLPSSPINKRLKSRGRVKRSADISSIGPRVVCRFQ
jgi:hypothetical protein